MLKHLLHLLAIFLLVASASAHASESIEYKLATIDAGRSIPTDHITVARFRSLLHQLSATYTENAQQIADMTVKAKQILKKDGINESLISIMEGMNQILPQRIENQRYAEYVSAYVALRSQGQSHTEAVRGLQAMLRSILTRK